MAHEILNFFTRRIAAVILTGLAAVSVSANECFTDKEVSFDSTAEGIRLAGTLSTPNDRNERPAVLLITGNGPHTRDQIISKSPMFRMLGEHFAGLGFVVLRTDARGYGKSTGPNDWEKYTTADRIADNRAALAFLRKQMSVDKNRIVLFGHSEGALIAAALAAADKNIALTILLTPSILRGDKVVAGQLAGSLLRSGADEKTAAAVRNEFLRFAEFLLKGGEDDAEFEKIALAFLKAHGVAADKLDPKLARSLLAGYLKSPWYRHFFAFDPAEDLSKISSPVLAIFGGADENVPWPMHLPPLIEALGKTRNPDFAAVVIPDQDHFFFEFEGRMLEKHEPGRMLVADELDELLAAELGRRRLSGGVCGDSPG